MCEGTLDTRNARFVGPRVKSVCGLTKNGYLLIVPLLPADGSPPVLLNRGWVSTTSLTFSRFAFSLCLSVAELPLSLSGARGMARGARGRPLGAAGRQQPKGVAARRDAAQRDRLHVRAG
jgi:hypothetical protein